MTSLVIYDIFCLMSGQQQRENRCFPRLPFHSKVRYQLRGKPVFDSGISRDISCGGLRLTNEEFIPASTLLMLEINVLNRVLKPVGKVAWSIPLAHSHRSQTGIKFVEFDIRQRGYLNDFINMQNVKF